MKKAMSAVATMVIVALLSGCAGLTAQQQRILTGGAAGAATGAVISGVTGSSLSKGAVVGGALGAVGGAVVHELK
ncbi:MAG: YMGG-like glycine zipper-containing protein [Thermodesulfobacteriota bacterium]